MNIRTSTVACLCLLPAVFAVSCGSDTPGPAIQGTIIQSDVPRNAAPDVSPRDSLALVDGNSAFAFALYSVVRSGNDNIFFSPHSISLALAMTYAGAMGNTETQMADVMRYSLPQDRLHPAFNSLDLALAARGQGAAGQDGEPFRLEIANSIWGQTGYGFLPAFLDRIAENYGAGLRLLDFQSEPEPSRVTINNWVSDNTEGKIQNLIPGGAITPLTRLVLCNAVYFNAKWLATFSKEGTHDAEFHLLDGSLTTVPMMSQTEAFPYAEGDGYQAIELPYDGGETAMDILVPASGRFAEFEGALTAERASAIVAALASRQVQLSMPKFSYTTTLGLASTLADMGMRDAFAAGTADFSGMDGTRDLFIGDVLHKAFVRVDENGTEAAAATAVVMYTTSMPVDEIVLNIDRPFVFLIRDTATGTILFLGRVVNPAEP